MSTWSELDPETQKAAIEEVAEQEGLPAQAVEKDQWVSIALRAVFSLSCADHLTFKGGTSLSKAWGSIERFSEDIDLILDREFLGYGGWQNRSQIKKLKRASCEFLQERFVQDLEDKLQELDIPYSDLRVQDIAPDQPDKDPVSIYLEYGSVTEEDAPHLVPMVRLEIGSLSPVESNEQRSIRSLIDRHFFDREFAEEAIDISCVHPRRIFLEKAFLLHEEFQKDPESIRTERLSRHLYDLDRLSGTSYEEEALGDPELYRRIMEHRQRFTPVRGGVDQSTLHPGTIDFIPPEEVQDKWKEDYREMQESMIHGASKDYDELIANLRELRDRFRSVELD